MNTKETTRQRTGRDKRKRTRQDVVYTQPGPFNRNRFLLHLLSIVAVVLALTFGLSLFFTVKQVEVYGAEKYTPWQIREASGLKDGENLLGISEARISSLIEDNLTYVNKVRVKIKLPDTVCIHVEELEVVYSVASDDGQWWLIRADGRVVDSTNAAEAERYTKLDGVTLTAPQIGEMAVATEAVPDTTDPDAETVPVTVTGAQRLRAAISVMIALESNSIIGQVSGINLENLNDLQLWYGDRFQVLLGDGENLGYKISAMKAAVDQMSQYQSGILDVSFTVDTGDGEPKVIHTPFA
jgi:cell division protein FtsQ